MPMLFEEEEEWGEEEEEEEKVTGYSSFLVLFFSLSIFLCA